MRPPGRRRPGPPRPRPRPARPSTVRAPRPAPARPRGRLHDSAVRTRGQRRVLGLGVGVQTDDLLLAGLDPGNPVPVRFDQPRLHVGNGRDRAALLLDHRHLVAGSLDELVDQTLHDYRALEDVRVLEDVGLQRDHLLDPEAPLLVPGPGQSHRLVPGRELEGPRPGVAGQDHGQGLDHDPLDVVLGLGLGQPERVDLDPVPEPEHLRIFDSVALPTDLGPEPAHRLQLRDFLDESDPGVDEERDPAEHPGEVLVGDLAPGLDFVEHRDRVGERVGDLLNRRGAGLLQVVGADVDRVPRGHLVDREGDHVGDQAHRGLGREGVGTAREVLLDDVVLGRPLELRAIDSGLLGRGDVEPEHPGGDRVDRHRGVHLAERDAIHQGFHVTQVRDRNADLADFATRERVVRVVAGLGRQVEGDREACLALGQVRPVELVRAPGVGVAGVGPDYPGPVGFFQPVVGSFRHRAKDTLPAPPPVAADSLTPGLPTHPSGPACV